MTRANFDQISVEEEIKAGTHDCDVSGCSSVAHYPKKRGSYLGNVIVGGEREICSGPECIGHEGGRRESGSHDDQLQDAHGPQHTTHGRLTAGDDSGTRAATPGRAAANPAAFCPCPDCGRELGHDRATLATMDWRDERIRALEAELAALEKGAVEGSWRARAEKAEARVKELEDRFALEEEANAELRGEDSR